MLKEANYQSVDHTPTIPVKRVDKMYSYSKQALQTLKKYPYYRLALPATVGHNQEDDEYTLKLRTGEKRTIQESSWKKKKKSSHLESDFTTQYSNDEKGK